MYGSLSFHSSKESEELAPMSSAPAKYFGNILYLGFCRPSIERTIVAHLQYQGVLDDGLVAKMLSELRVDVVSSQSTIQIQQCMTRTGLSKDGARLSTQT